MASIYGVELKSVKTWQGEEGLGLQANVYIDKKKVGMVTDDAWGGPLRFDFDTSELDKRAEKYRVNVWNNKPENAKYLSLYNSGSDFEDAFIDEIYNLLMVEKSWKRQQKTQWKNLVRYQIGPHGVAMETFCMDTLSDAELVKALAKGAKCKESEVIVTHRYKDANEFVIA